MAQARRRATVPGRVDGPLPDANCPDRDLGREVAYRAEQVRFGSYPIPIRMYYSNRAHQSKYLAQVRPDATPT
jgi:hypothetical protein